MNYLTLYADPLGDLYVEWKISTTENISINLPHYKYEMSNILGIPVPFSSMAEKLECEVLKVVDQDAPEIGVPFAVEKTFRGNVHLLVSDNKPNCTTVIQYVIRNFITRDKIYFNFVFSLASPLPVPITVNFKLKARFSYDINSYKFKLAIIDKKTARIRGKRDLVDHNRIGDFIYADGTGLVFDKNVLDLHVHASRLPVMIDRRIFWMVVFAIAIIGVGTLLSIFKFK